ncbi:hypothetical protein ACVIGB_000063 [Bradyrhizobium sp. USDA 4341]
MPTVRIPTCTLATQKSDTVLTTWFERDRAHVCLSRKDRDGDAGETIIEWWDDAVSQAVEDGFLNPRDWHGTAYAYAAHHSMIKPLQIDLAPGWSFAIKTFLEKTPSKDRPREQPDRLEWFADLAQETADTVVADRQFALLSADQAETLTETITSALYDLALEAEEFRLTALKITCAAGSAVIETDGENMVLRGGADATEPPFQIGNQTATFSFRWRHSEGPETGEPKAVFQHPDKPGLRRDMRLAERLKTSLVEFIQANAEKVEDFVNRTRERNSLFELERALDRGAPGSAEAQELTYDAARATTLLGNEATPALAPAI